MGIPLERDLPRPRVDVLSHDLSLNCATRALRLAELLGERYDARVLGPRFGSEVFGPCRDRLDPSLVVPARPFPGFRRALAALRARATGDVLLAQKPRFGSFGTALAVAELRGVPVVLDIDDDEPALFSGDRPGWLRRLASWRHPNGRAWTLRTHGRIPEAASLTAGSPTLARRYGATFVPYAPDGRLLDPARYPDEVRDRQRRALGLDDRFVVVFCGSARRHKGLVAAARAVGALEGEGAVGHLLVVGAIESAELERDIRVESRGRVTVRPPVPLEERGAVLALGDAVVLAQRDTSYARAQLPAKLFDAMAMGIPIVVTRVGDSAEILGDAGVTVPAGDPQALAEALRDLAASEERRGALGRAARERFLARYDAEIVGPRLASVVEAVLEGASVRGEAAAV